MKLKIALLGGDGIGPEVLNQAVKCLKAIEETFNHQFTFIKAPIEATSVSNTGEPLPKETLELCKEADAVLFGAIGALEYDENPNTKVRREQGLLKLRKELGLYASIRPVKVFKVLSENSILPKKIVRGTDLVIYRELSGGIYFGEKTISEDGSKASDICEYTEEEIARIAHLAFKDARSRRRKLTLVDKASVLETSRLWRKVVTEISLSYPDVQFECMFVDVAIVQMMMNPKQFDVILTDNMYGDVLSDQGSVLIGSVGILPSASIGKENAIFAPYHGAYPKAKGKNIANPVAAIFSAAMLLQNFELNEEADAIVKAVKKSFKKNVITKDILGSSKYGTDYVGDFIADNITYSDEDLNLNDENIDLGKSTII